jgi:hypothetical protein
MKLFKNFTILDLLFFIFLMLSLFDIDQINSKDLFMVYGAFAMILFCIRWGIIVSQLTTPYLIRLLLNSRFFKKKRVN